MSVLFLFSGLGVINGILAGLYLLLRKQSTIADMYFAGLLLALSIRIGKSVYYYFSEYVDLTILQIGLSACIFIGPFFYLYTKYLRKRLNSIELKDAVLLLLLLIFIIAIGVVFPYSSFPEVWNGQIIYGIYSVWILFTVGGLYNSYLLLKDTGLSIRLVSKSQSYFIVIVLAMLFITITYQAALFVGFTYIWGALIFSFSFYFLVMRILFTSLSAVPKVQTSPIENGEELLESLNILMQTEKLYLNQNFKLSDLVEKSGLPKNVVSRLLNEQYKKGYSNYVKEYRIDEAKELIHSRSELSIEGIGYESGFKSKSAFYEAFKKIVNCTPAEFKSRL